MAKEYLEFRRGAGDDLTFGQSEICAQDCVASSSQEAIALYQQIFFCYQDNCANAPDVGPVPRRQLPSGALRVPLVG